MPRYARLHCPGALVHVIARFVNHNIRMAGPKERAAFLDRVPAALARSDWTLCAYALMGSHVHLALLAGDAPPWRFLKPLHIAFARFINRADRTLGPVFAERATTVVMPAERMAPLVAYIHNNPVRAGLVGHPIASNWTSHRAWVGLEPEPPWLAVQAALGWAGFDAGEQGRSSFAAYVAKRKDEPRDPTWSRVWAAQSRAQVRTAVGLPVEISSPQQVADAQSAAVLSRAVSLARPRWDGDLKRLVQAVSSYTGVALAEICSRSHRPQAVEARRLAVTAGAWVLRREVSEVGAVLGITDSSASRLLRRADRVMDSAERIAQLLEK